LICCSEDNDFVETAQFEQELISMRSYLVFNFGYKFMHLRLGGVSTRLAPELECYLLGALCLLGFVVVD